MTMTTSTATGATGWPGCARDDSPWMPWHHDSRQSLLEAVNRFGRSGLDPLVQRILCTHPFLIDARHTQAAPWGRWRTWMFMGGRGAGKTRAGAEWVRWAALQARCGRIALVGPTFADVREVMIEGPSGLRWTEPRRDKRPVYQPSRHRLEFPNGAVAYAFSAEDPDALRGPQFDAAWCDEIGAWQRGEAVWDMAQFGLRMGHAPRVVATTTPRAVPLVRRLLNDAQTVITRSAMADNVANLSSGFVAAMTEAYGGTRLGRQELDGEYMEDADGAMFLRSQIDGTRVQDVPYPLDDIVVAVDPCATHGPKAHACGIVAAGVKDGRAYVVGDASAAGLMPHDWAARAGALAEAAGASVILAEANQGGEMVRETLRAAGITLPVRLVHARLGKRGRAGPVAALYQQGRVAHAGVFASLEDQMCQFTGHDSAEPSDRVDALVWALWALLMDGRGPRVRAL